MTCIIINGSIRGRTGNTAKILLKIRKILISKGVKVKIINLYPQFEWKKVKKQIAKSDCLIFASGTYWMSWGSPMQTLFEQMTKIEGAPSLLGKPAAVVVTMHSVGGEEVVAKMTSVLSTMGCLIPPMSGWTYSFVGQQALHYAPNKGKLLDDVWAIEDLNIVINNLLEATRRKGKYIGWDVHKNPNTLWF